MTKDYDPFNPYTNPELGKVVSVTVYDSDTSEMIDISESEIGEILVDIVGGNECVIFDNELSAFV